MEILTEENIKHRLHPIGSRRPITPPPSPEGKIEILPKEKECIGRYCTREQAEEVAWLETRRTERFHHSILSYYKCPYTRKKFMYWGIIKSEKTNIVTS